MKFTLRPVLALALAGLIVQPPTFAASHREAPITALDQKADITDWFTFVSPEHPDRVVMILNVDPFLEPANGPNYFPFDPGILYEMKVDNNHDGLAEVTFQFRFQTQIRNAGLFTGFAGGIAGIPPITALSGPGSDGLNLSQTYTVTMIANGQQQDITVGQTLYAVPSNAGPRTMPNYNALRQQGVYTLSNGIRVFAGTVADPFFIDLGAAFDSLNFRMASGGGVLPASIDGDDANNYSPNTLAGYNVNSIAIEVPISMLTVDGGVHRASDKAAVLGTWGTTSRHAIQILGGDDNDGGYGWAQVQRMGNPLINELIIGTGYKDRFSMDYPQNDGQFANFFLNPLLATVFGSLGIPVAPAPRKDLLILGQYQAPICPGCGPGDAGPVADLLRINTGIPPTAAGSVKRMGFLAGDTAGWPNGRRLTDDVVDIAARAVAGILVDGTKYGTAIGDGVNAPAVAPSATFPFVAPAYDGRGSSHNAGPGLPGCPVRAGGVCPAN
ncbi:MAG TPA: DUF4331 domain-containing protein [Bryobacteraceae bacterium]|nr:DUF4331 domain-containing protein [Bryobacteraceae bacterium]